MPETIQILQYYDMTPHLSASFWFDKFVLFFPLGQYVPEILHDMWPRKMTVSIVSPQINSDYCAYQTLAVNKYMNFVWSWKTLSFLWMHRNSYYGSNWEFKDIHRNNRGKVIYFRKYPKCINEQIIFIYFLRVFTRYPMHLLLFLTYNRPRLSWDHLLYQTQGGIKVDEKRERKDSSLFEPVIESYL